MTCVKFGWNWQMLSMFLCYLVNISPWKNVWPLIWTNLNPSSYYALCKVWLKLALWFWRKFSKKILQCIFAVFFYLPLEKGMVIYVEQTWTFFIQGWLIGWKFGWNLSLDSWEVENVKSLQAYRQRDDERQALRTAQVK